MYTRILVPTDGSPTATAGVREAIRLARGWNIAVRLIHVVDRLSLLQNLLPARLVAETIKSMQRNGMAALEDAKRLAGRDGVAAQTVLKTPDRGSVADAIVAEASRWKADLIVMGTHGQRGAGTAVIGSTAQGVVRRSKPPVLLVTAVFSARGRRR
jgi:nucleotide-binding universal stress UspA family protein